MTTLSKFKKELDARNKPIDTTVLQIESLYCFASKLGYVIRGGFENNQGFFSPTTQGEFRHVSFNTMVYWHDNCFNSYAKGTPNLAYASIGKLVERVKLQRTNTGIKVQNHYVRLINDKNVYDKSRLAQVCPDLTDEQREALISSGIIK
tara:strand:- start:6612 stop:7058 length:447 start_codon:yes stop_codon:yes gene_type:complete